MDLFKRKGKPKFQRGTFESMSMSELADMGYTKDEAVKLIKKGEVPGRVITPKDKSKAKKAEKKMEKIVERVTEGEKGIQALMAAAKGKPVSDQTMRNFARQMNQDPHALARMKAENPKRYQQIVQQEAQRRGLL